MRCVPLDMGPGGGELMTIVEIACCEQCGICCGTHGTLKHVMPPIGGRGHNEFVKVLGLHDHIHVEFYVARE